MRNAGSAARTSVFWAIASYHLSHRPEVVVSFPFPRWIPALVLLLSAVAFTRADDPKAASTDEPLPKGAKVRLGNPRLIFRYTPTVAPIPPDYKAFAVAEGFEGVRRYDLTTGQPLDKERAKAGNLAGGQILMSGDGKRYVTLHTGILTVRDATNGKEIKQLKPPGGFTTAMVFNAPTASLSTDGKMMAQGGSGTGNKAGIVVWDVEKGEPIFQTGVPLNGPAIPVLSPDGKMVAVRGIGFGTTPGTKPEDDPAHTIWVYEVDGGKELLQGRVTAGTYQPINAVAFAPDGSTLAASVGDGVIDVFDLKTGKTKPPLLGRSGQGARVAFSPDSKTLAAVSTDGAIQRWNLADGKPVGTTDGPAVLTTQPQGLAFADNDRVLAWGVVGQCPMVWEAPSGKILTQLPEHTQGIKSIAFAAGGKEIITAGLDGRIVRWDAATGKLLGPVTLKPSRGMITGVGGRLIVTLAPDGTRALTTTTPPAVMDLASGTEEFSMPRGSNVAASTSSIPSADMTKLMILSTPFDRSKPGQCAVWDLETRQKLVEMEMQATQGYLPAAAISPSGKRMVTAAYRPNPQGGQQALVITGWDLKTGKKLGEVEDAKTTGQLFVAAASDSFAVVSSGVGRLRAYDYENGRGGDEFTGKERPESVVGPVVFAPDGKRFVSGGPAEEIGMYAVKSHEWPSGKVLHTFTGHTAPVNVFAFSPDGNTLATGSQDATVLLWDLSVVK
jgi:WD40 repeat protein